MLGEIDLSIGSVSGLAAAVLLVTHVNHGCAALLAVLVAVLAGTLVGLIQGSIFAKIGVPSFIVTLAGLLIWQGVQLRVLGEQGTINLPPAGSWCAGRSSPSCRAGWPSRWPRWRRCSTCCSAC